MKTAATDMARLLRLCEGAWPGGLSTVKDLLFVVLCRQHVFCCQMLSMTFPHFADEVYMVEEVGKQ